MICQKQKKSRHRRGFIWAVPFVLSVLFILLSISFLKVRHFRISQGTLFSYTGFYHHTLAVSKMEERIEVFGPIHSREIFENVETQTEDANKFQDKSLTGSARHVSLPNTDFSNNNAGIEDIIIYKTISTRVTKHNKSEDSKGILASTHVKKNIKKDKNSLTLPLLQKPDRIPFLNIFRKEYSSNNSHVNIRVRTNLNKNQDRKKSVDENVVKLLYNNTKEPVRNDTCLKCFKNDFKIHINTEQLCASSPKIDLVILISSSPMAFEERLAIRKTWGSNCNHKKSKIKCVFIIGNKMQSLISENKNLPANYYGKSENNLNTTDKLIQESANFKDIVQFDFVDSYGNLTFKTLSSFRWAVNFCPSAKYIMKTDTDMFVNTELLPFLLERAPNYSFVGGNCWGVSSPHRDISSKYFVSYRSYKRNTFPPMCSGTGYIVSKDVARSVLRESANIPFFYLEDVYIALCLQKLRIKPRNLQGFYNVQAQPLDPCHYRNHVVTSHYFHKLKLYKYWEDMKSCDLETVKQTYLVLPYPMVN